MSGKRKRPGTAARTGSPIRTLGNGRPSKAKRTPASAPAARPALVLPAQLARRLDEIEGRVAALEQLVICPLACSPSCAFQCPTGVQS